MLQRHPRKHVGRELAVTHHDGTRGACAHGGGGETHAVAGVLDQGDLACVHPQKGGEGVPAAPLHHPELGFGESSRAVAAQEEIGSLFRGGAWDQAP
jgi:hypothetical protein